MLLSKKWAMAHVGTVSHYTLKSEDLGEAFASLLDEIGEELSLGKSADDPAWTMACARWNGRKDTLVGEWERESAKGDEADDETMGEIVNEMFDLVSEALPEGFYFGSTEGDGADFGIWQTEGADADAL